MTSDQPPRIPSSPCQLRIFRYTEYTSVRFVLANSLFLIAHFHNAIIGGRAVRRDGGLQLLGPQDVRLQAHERWGKASFLIEGVGSTTGAAPWPSSSANRYFASWPPGASVGYGALPCNTRAW